MIHRIRLALKGFLMGTADVIPGVSGGTMALIVGIYRQLVFSIRSIGPSLLKSVFKGAFWKGYFGRILGKEPFKKPEELREQSAEERLERDIEIIAFLSVLGLGIIVAVLSMVKVLPILLQKYPWYMSSLFFGLVLASAKIPFSMIKKPAPRNLVSLFIAAILTFFIMGLKIDNSSMSRGSLTVSYTGADKEAVKLTPFIQFTTPDDGKHEKLAPRVTPVQNYTVTKGSTVTIDVVSLRAGEDGNLPAGSIVRAEPSISGLSVTQGAPLTGGTNTPLWFVFLAGAIAICAMILPGVSGSFLLLMLGQYGYILHKVYSLVYERNTDMLSVVAVFLLGIAVGILAFSRFLNYLLERHHDLTMAALTGLMLGSLRKLWPFREFQGQNEVNVLPSTYDSTVGITIACFVVGVLIIVTMNLLSRDKEKIEH